MVGKSVSPFSLRQAIMLVAGLLACLITTAHADTQLTKGSLLIAARELPDPNFAESVVLMVHNDERGALGLIINRPTDISASELLPAVDGLAEFREPLYLGGPVAAYGIMMLISTEDPPADTEHVFDNIHVSGNREHLEEIAADATDRPDHIRLYAGHAGWAPGQLDAEIARGDWKVIPARSSLVFSGEPLKIWSKLAPPGRQFIVHR
jgi:putative transcriptional regulator